ncbi:hypothetical protein JCM6882_003651 [Rhodosporidiobolus microsporus]
MTSAAPPNFPPSVQYLASPLPSRLLPPHHKATYCTPCPPHLFPNPPPRVAIRKITDPSHPACGQSGLFNASNKPIERGTWVRDYVGIVHTEGEADGKSDYDLSLLREVVGKGEDGEVLFDCVGIDATKAGNEARFVNDYRGTGLPRPNAVFELRTFDLPSPPLPSGSEPLKGVRMAIWAGPHGVDKGAEICVSYGRGFWEKRKEEAEREKEERKARGEEEVKVERTGKARVGRARRGNNWTASGPSLPRRVRFGGLPEGEGADFEDSASELDPFPHLRLLLPLPILTSSTLLTTPLTALPSLTLDTLLLLDYLALLILVKEAALAELERDEQLIEVDVAVRSGVREVGWEMEVWRWRRRRERERWEEEWGRREEPSRSEGVSWEQLRRDWREGA